MSQRNERLHEHVNPAFYWAAGKLTISAALESARNRKQDADQNLVTQALQLIVTMYGMVEQWQRRNKKSPSPHLKSEAQHCLAKQLCSMHRTHKKFTLAS